MIDESVDEKGCGKAVSPSDHTGAVPVGCRESSKETSPRLGPWGEAESRAKAGRWTT